MMFHSYCSLPEAMSQMTQMCQFYAWFDLNMSFHVQDSTILIPIWKCLEILIPKIALLLKVKCPGSLTMSGQPTHNWRVPCLFGSRLHDWSYDYLYRYISSIRYSRNVWELKLGGVGWAPLFVSTRWVQDHLTTKWSTSLIFLLYILRYHPSKNHQIGLYKKTLETSGNNPRSQGGGGPFLNHGPNIRCKL